MSPALGSAPARHTKKSNYRTTKNLPEDTIKGRKNLAASSRQYLRPSLSCSRCYFSGCEEFTFVRPCSPGLGRWKTNKPVCFLSWLWLWYKPQCVHVLLGLSNSIDTVLVSNLVEVSQRRIDLKVGDMESRDIEVREEGYALDSQSPSPPWEIDVSLACHSTHFR